MNRRLAPLVVALSLAAAAGHAQQPPGGAGQRPASTAREDALDPSPVDPAKDPNIDLFVGDWRVSTPRTAYGALVFRDILTKLDSADPVRPIKRGAVLQSMHAISYATLAPGAVARGRGPAGDRQVFFTVGGEGQITVNGKTHALKDGVGFTLTPDFDFRMTSTGKAPLAFYVRSELLPGNYAPSPDITVVNRFDNDRRVGAHWAHICNGGPNGMNLCTIASRTMPQPHSHPNEEVWIAVKGESILSLGKELRRMVPGQAYRIPPTGLATHSNINLGEEPIQMIYMGVAARETNNPPPQNPPRDFARLDNSAFARGAEQDVDMYMGAWRDAFPRILHGNLYFRDMLTALQPGTDPARPTRKGAVLTHAEAVSYAMLEPGSTAHRIEGELKGVQQTSWSTPARARSPPAVAPFRCPRAWPSSSPRAWTSG